MTSRTISSGDRRFRIDTLAEDPTLARNLHELSVVGWPEFMLADAVSVRCWPRLFELAPELQFVLRDADSGSIVAAGHAVPCRWDGTVDGLPPGWDAVLEGGCQPDPPWQPDAVSALAIVVDPAARGTGCSVAALAAMRQLVVERGLQDLLAPVRPNWKHHYPLISMADYLTWTCPDGDGAFDPWLRTHVKLGATVLKVAESSMVIEGTVAQWESWTGTPMPGPGLFLVPGGLVPVVVDPDCGGRYVEPNVWVHHHIGGAS